LAHTIATTIAATSTLALVDSVWKNARSELALVADAGVCITAVSRPAGSGS
jgi:hypothetical protein